MSRDNGPMATATDYYALLGLQRNATEEQVRSAYRKLARQYHPDVNTSPDAAEKFNKITEAYEVLSDAERRQRYDMFGGAQGGLGDFGIGDLFETFFGSEFRRRAPRDHELDLTLPAGIDDGQQLRVAGEGEAGLRGGPSGDLYVLIRIKEHALFRREGDDLVHVLRISPAQASLGEDLPVPTIDGAEATVRVPSG